MKQFKLIAPHYDMVPGDIVYETTISETIFTTNKDVIGEPYLRIIPLEKVEEVPCVQ
jgi:hypothetical protein